MRMSSLTTSLVGFQVLESPDLNFTELSRKREIYHLYIIGHSSAVKYLHVIGGQAYRRR